MSIRNYKEGDINDKSLVVNCNTLKCDTLESKNIVIPDGGDINAHNITVDNDLKVKTQDGLNYIKYNTPTVGQAGYQLTVDTNGDTYWAQASAVGGVDNPMSQDLETNNFNIKLDNSNFLSLQPFNVQLNTNGTMLLNSQDILINAPNGVDLTGNDLKGVNNLTIGNTINMPFAQGELKMNDSSIKQAGGITMSGIFDLQGNITVDAGDINMIGQLNTGEINNVIMVRNENDLQNPLQGNYMIMDNINITQSYTLSGDCSFFGMGREGKASLNFNVPTMSSGYCLTITNYNCSFNDLSITNQSALYDLIDASNINKDKILTFTNTSFVDCKNNLLFITGFDLVDLNNCLFQYNYPPDFHYKHEDGSKLQITSCEFIRQGERANPITNWGTSPMVSLLGSFGAVQLTSSLYHPQQTQDGIFLDNSFTALEALISSNVFISLGLTTGQLINYNTSISQYPFLIVSDNTGILNQKSVIEAESVNNSIYTATVAGSFVPVDFGVGFNVLQQNRFSPTGNPYEFKYDAKQPIRCLITVNITATHNTGSNDDIEFGLNQNGNVVRKIQTSISSSVLKTFGFNAVVDLIQGDTLLFVIKNITSGSNPQGFLAVSFNGSLIEV